MQFIQSRLAGVRRVRMRLKTNTHGKTMRSPHVKRYSQIFSLFLLGVVYSGDLKKTFINNHRKFIQFATLLTINDIVNEMLVLSNTTDIITNST